MTARLTRSERTVAVLVANGRSQVSIAEEQGLTRGAIHAHMLHIRQKIGARTNEHAIALLIARGVIGPDEIVEA